MTSRQPLHTSAAQMEAQASLNTCVADNPLLSVCSQVVLCRAALLVRRLFHES